MAVVAFALAAVITPLLTLALFRRHTNVLLAALVELFCGRRLRVRGPPWTFPNGQLLDKFLRGGQKSRAWRLYGPVYRIWSLFAVEVVITTPDDVKTFYADSRHHEKSRSSNAGWLFEQLLGEAMGLTNGSKWRRTRAKFEPYFTARFIHEHGPIFRDDAEIYLNERFRDGDARNLTSPTAFSMFPFLCTAKLVYGSLSKEEIDKLLAVSQLRMKVFGKILQGGIFCFPIAKWLRRQTMQDLESFTASWHEFNTQMLQKRKTSPIARIWQGSEENENATKEILQTLDEMLFANLDVSAHVLNALIMFLAEAEDAQCRIVEELQKDSNIDKYCSRRDTFLHNCLSETLRLAPIAAFTMPERSPNPKSFSGVEIPPYTWVLVDVLSINHNPAFWGQDSDKFRPSRYENIKQEDLKWNFFTYGFGLRQCLGKFLADYIVKTFVVQLLLKYRWKLDEGVDNQDKPSSAWALPTSTNLIFLRRIPSAPPTPTPQTL